MTRWVALAALALIAPACGDSGGTATASPSPTPTTQTPSPSAGPSLRFTLRPEPGATSSGTITLTARADAMTVQLDIKGLPSNSSHISHIHVGTCSQRGSIAFALNQVIADGQGMSITRTTLKASYPPRSGHWYVVVHSGADMQGTNAKYLLCGNLFS
jgi:hypothetical protein